MSKKIESMSRTMKDSGIPWIGEIPKGWKTAYLKHFCKVNSGREIEMESEASDVDAVPVFGSGGVFKYTNKAQFAGEAVMFGRKGTLGKPIYVNERFWAVDTMYYLTFGNMLKAKYCYYQLSVFNWEPYITQTALPSIVATDIVNSYFAFPPLAEQHLIATFLDKKCSEIDSLIDLQEQMIEELKAYKQSVITEAVTKGLNPNVQMKDSGVEWIGDVPEEWEVRKIKYLSQVVRGGSPRPAGDSRYYGGNIPFMKVADITKDDKMYVDSCEFSIKEAGLSNTRMINPQTLLLTNSGATLGVPKINTFSTTFNDGIAAFLNLSKKLDLKFAYYSLKARTKFFLDSASLGIGQPNLNTDIIGSTFLTLPPLAEQQAIADYLDKKCGEIDELITIKQQKIESLKEYKKSVIYEYVTGKREVE